MLVPLKLKNELFEVMAQYFGVSLIIRDPPVKGEHARSYHNNNFLVIREVGDEGSFLEVVYTDKNWLELLEKTWLSVIQALMSEDENDVQE